MKPRTAPYLHVSAQLALVMLNALSNSSRSVGVLLPPVLAGRCAARSHGLWPMLVLPAVVASRTVSFTRAHHSVARGASVRPFVCEGWSRRAFPQGRHSTGMVSEQLVRSFSFFATRRSVVLLSPCANPTVEGTPRDNAARRPSLPR